MADQFEIATEDKDVTESAEELVMSAHLNDEKQNLLITDFYVDDEGKIAIEMEPLHGGQTVVEQFDAPGRGSLHECHRLSTLLDNLNISPINAGEIVGMTVPGEFRSVTGWKIDRQWLNGVQTPDSTEPTVRDRTETVIAQHKDIIAVVVLVGAEFFAVLLLLLLAL